MMPWMTAIDLPSGDEARAGDLERRLPDRARRRPCRRPRRRARRPSSCSVPEPCAASAAKRRAVGRPVVVVDVEIRAARPPGPSRSRRRRRRCAAPRSSPRRRPSRACARRARPVSCVEPSTKRKAIDRPSGDQRRSASWPLTFVSSLRRAARGRRDPDLDCPALPASERNAIALPSGEKAALLARVGLPSAPPSDAAASPPASAGRDGERAERSRPVRVLGPSPTTRRASVGRDRDVVEVADVSSDVEDRRRWRSRAAPRGGGAREEAIGSAKRSERAT